MMIIKFFRSPPNDTFIMINHNGKYSFMNSVHKYVWVRDSRFDGKPIEEYINDLDRLRWTPTKRIYYI